MVQSKQMNAKTHHSSSNLEESIGGVVGNSINKRNVQKVVSPNVRHKNGIPTHTKGSLVQSANK